MKFNPVALQAARKKANLSKPQLAVQARLSLDTVYELEKANGRAPGPNVVGKLAEALDVDWRFFYDDNFRESENMTSAAS